MLAAAVVRPFSHPGSGRDARPRWTVALVAAGLLAMAGCADDPGAPWNTPTYLTTYCESCDIAESALGNADYGPAKWVQSPNYSVANRGVGKISMVIVHTVQGSYNGCISWFQNTNAKVSAHFVVSKTGDVTQMVKEKDIGWHVGSENGYTVGIEHEGYVTDPNYVTPQMLDASAKLTCYLLKKYQLPASKVGVKGHVELPNQTHTDPGKYWPWPSYLAKIQECMNGTVTPTCPTSCDDGIACTDDSCVAGNCVHANNTGAVCWDGDACTAGEKCSAGKCVGGSIVKDCNDNNACTTDGCSGGSCKAGSPKNCDDGDPCTTGEACSGGQCQPGVAKACDDGNPCTTGDVCSGGGCKPGTAKNCNDNNLCTTDSCTAGACKNQPISGACNDGNPCTVGETCGASGVCGGGAAKLCMDDNPCTTDSCVAGACVFAPISGPCDDGDSCSTGDYCAQGLCLAGQAKDCDDDLACTTDSCIDGACQHQGSVKPATKTCQGKDVATADPCGGPAQIAECPAAQPCKNGACGGVVAADASADSNPGNGDPPDGTAKPSDVAGGDAVDPGDVVGKPPMNQMKVATDSGCSSRTSVPPSSADSGWLAGCGLLIGAWWWRRRQG